jgi:hypothetical protein
MSPRYLGKFGIAMLLLLVGLFLPFRLFFAKAPKNEKEEE